MRKTISILIAFVSFGLSSQEIIQFSNTEFEFCLTKKCRETECEITKIEILKNGTLKQTILPNENYFSKTFPNNRLFIIEDMNFDGKADFRLMEFLTAEPNVPFLYWIYNPIKKLFEKNKSYGEITSPEFNYEKKQINSIWIDGCCKQGRDTYELKSGIPKLTERFVSGEDSHGYGYTKTWKLINGKLELIEQTIE